MVAGPALGAGQHAGRGLRHRLRRGQRAKFGHPEIKGGVFNPVAAALLPRLVGRKKAFEMILLGGPSLTAADAERIGLITRAVPDDKLEAEVAALVQRFQEAQRGRPAARAARDGRRRSTCCSPDAVRHAEDVYLNQLMATEDAEEGLKAVMGKRKPVWKDR